MQMKTLLFISSLILLPLTQATALDLALTPQMRVEALGKVDPHTHVRTDIRDYILAEAPHSRLQQRSLFQLAHDYQSAIRQIENEKIAQSWALKIIKSEFCVRYAFGESGYTEAAKLHGQMLNTHIRARIGIRLNTYLMKALPYTPAAETWKKECRFLKAGSLNGDHS
jgi:hypothetical protein